MILPRKYWETNLKELVKEPYNYMIVKTDHLAYQRDKDRLERGMEVISLCNSLYIVNEAYRNMGVKKEFEFSVLYQVLEAIYNNRSFTDKELEKVLDFDKRLDEFYKGMQYLSPKITEYLYLDSEIKLLLFGFDFEAQYEFKSLDELKYEEAISHHYQLENKFYAGKLSVKDLKKEVLKHFRDKVKELKKPNKSAA